MTIAALIAAGAVLGVFVLIVLYDWLGLSELAGIAIVLAALICIAWYVTAFDRAKYCEVMAHEYRDAPHRHSPDC
jgi:hypothetical protein